MNAEWCMEYRFIPSFQFHTELSKAGDQVPCMQPEPTTLDLPHKPGESPPVETITVGKDYVKFY